MASLLLLSSVAGSPVQSLAVQNSGLLAAPSRARHCKGQRPLPRPCRASSSPDPSPQAEVASSGEDSPSAPGTASSAADASAAGNRRGRRQAESTDWIASAVTRRFGIGAGLAWVGFLAFGVISEQLKTRTEVALEESMTRDVEEPNETVLPNGVRFTDLRIGGGASPVSGDLVLLSIVGKVQGSERPFVDTVSRGNKDLVFTFGSARSFRGGVTEGLVAAIQGMRAGGRRVVRVPPELGFGTEDLRLQDSLGEEILIPGKSELVYTVELKRVSISPS